MKLTSLIRSTLAALAVSALAATGGRAFAQEIPAAPVPTIGLGLHTVLSTGGYKFVIPATADPAADVASRSSFPASVSLYNRSASDIDFAFPDPVKAEKKFTFRIFDKAGALVWQSDAEIVAPTVITNEKLAKGARWSRTLLIPLKPGGTALAPGAYSLEAVVDADKKPGAVTIFEVAPAPDPSTVQGINGLVLKPNPPEAANPLLAEIPAAGAYVSVVELPEGIAPLARPLFVWSGRTDDAGKFTVKTPEGRFRVTATLLNTTPAAAAGNVVPSVTKSVEVTVASGKFSDVTISLPAPPVVQGINGLVLYGPITPVAIPGEPNEKPAAGARVTIEEIVAAPAVPARAPFRWIGVTNGEGRFQARTPAGKFKVTATLGGTPVALPNAIVIGRQATAEVTVEAGKFANTTLHIDSGLR